MYYAFKRGYKEGARDAFAKVRATSSAKSTHSGVVINGEFIDGGLTFNEMRDLKNIVSIKITRNI
jgi:hypothetical protein